MDYFYLVLGLVLLLGGIGFNIYTIRKFGIDKTRNLLSKKEFFSFLGGEIALSIGGALVQAAIAGLSKWNMDSGHMTMSVFGAFFFCLSFSALWFSFYLYFWRKDADETQRKATRLTLIVSIPLSLVFFLLLGEGVGEFLGYPLSSGFSIDGSGFHFITYQSARSGLTITWYGVVIIFGALVAYWVSDHRFYKKFGRHGILDTCLLLVLPAGIIAARIWYVVGNWNGDGAGGPNFSQYCANGQWYKMFEIWNGGITILGGAVGGIIAGALFVIFRRKYVDVRWAADIIVPSILIAQCIGRWGNFFNHEVYGSVVNMSDWTILPTWIRNQMAVSFDGGHPVGGQMYIPLFLIEGIINLVGYFVIAWGVAKLWKPKTDTQSPKWFHRSLGDLAAFYMIWYGITRMIMEPLRDPHYNMGSNGMWSFWNSMVYIIIGVVAIVFFHVFDYFLIKKGKPLDRSDLSYRPAKAVKEAVPVVSNKKEKEKVDLSKAPKKIVIQEDKDEPKE